MQPRIIFPVLLLGLLIALAGCTGTQGTPPGPAGTSGTPAGQAGSSLVPGPTDVMPEPIAVTVDVGEKDYLGKIPVTFQGGKGQINVKKIDVQLTRVDGSVQKETVGTNKGDGVDLQGTRGSGSERGLADRVQVWVTMNSGQTFKTADVLREYRSRG
jgi:hypothetical protein